MSDEIACCYPPHSRLGRGAQTPAHWFTAQGTKMTDLCSLRGLMIPHYRLSQKVSRKPNCILRIALAELITPKLAEVEPLAGTEAPGCPRFTWLNAFVASARKRSLTRSVKLKSRERARSTVLYPGP